MGLDRRTMADWPAVRIDVSNKTTEVLGFTIYVLILYIAPPFYKRCVDIE